MADYSRLSGAFLQVTTESLRGLPRPSDDQYADRLVYADLLFAVWGMRGGIG